MTVFIRNASDENLVGITVEILGEAVENTDEEILPERLVFENLNVFSEEKFEIERRIYHICRAFLLG